MPHLRPRVPHLLPELSAEMDGGTARRSLLLVSVAALILSSCPGPATASPAAEEQSEAPSEEDRPKFSSTSAEVVEVARTAQLICGTAPVEEALLSARMQPGVATGAAGQLLEGLGLRTAFERPWTSAFSGAGWKHKKRWIR